MRLVDLVLIGLGGFAGAIVRHGISDALKKVDTNDFTLGVFISNVAGCLIAGILIPFGDLKKFNTFAMPLLSLGFCGAFTTFSSYALGVIERFEVADRAVMGVVILIATIISCFLFVFIGYFLSARFIRPIFDEKENDRQIHQQPRTETV